MIRKAIDRHPADHAKNTVESVLLETDKRETAGHGRIVNRCFSQPLPLGIRVVVAPAIDRGARWRRRNGYLKGKSLPVIIQNSRVGKTLVDRHCRSIGLLPLVVGDLLLQLRQRNVLRPTLTCARNPVQAGTCPDRQDQSTGQHDVAESARICASGSLPRLFIAPDSLRRQFVGPGEDQRRNDADGQQQKHQLRRPVG